MKKHDGIIFDLDGTLWDATYVITDAWNEGYRKMKLGTKSVTRDDIMSCMGLIIPEIAAKLYPEHDKRTQLEIMDNTIKIENSMLLEKGGVLFPKLEDTLGLLKASGYNLSIVSNCQAGYIEVFMRAHGLEKYFDDFECPGNTGLLKAENIRLVIERNGLKSPVYVGDTQKDADASKKAGIPFVFAAYGFGSVKEYYNKVNSFEELIKIF